MFASFQNLPFVRESHWWSQLIFGANVLSSDSIVQWVLYFLDCQDNADVISAFSISSNYLLWKTVNCISARLKELLVSKCGSVIIAPISHTLREHGCGNFQMYLCRCKIWARKNRQLNLVCKFLDIGDSPFLGFTNILADLLLSFLPFCFGKNQQMRGLEMNEEFVQCATSLQPSSLVSGNKNRQLTLALGLTALR